MKAFFNRSPGAMAARIAAVALFALATAFAGVFTMPPLDRDEARFAQATAQMIETGDYVAIRFQNDERNKKPAGIHWLQAMSVNAISSPQAREIWAYRAPSVAGAVLAALFTYAAGAHLFGVRVGLIASALLASAPAFAGEAMIAKTDACLLACVTAAQAALIRIYGAAQEGRRTGLGLALAFWVAIGAGILIKGPVIVLVVGACFLVLQLRPPQHGLHAHLRPVLGIFLLLLMVSPWLLAVNDATDGRFVKEAIGRDMVAKLSNAQESHAGPPGYHIILVFALFWPAAPFIMQGFHRAFAARSDWRYWFLLSWIIPSWIIFELTATKLPHYTLPLYPAIAIFAADAAVNGARNDFPRLQRIETAIYVAVGLAFAAVVAALPILFRQATLESYAFIAASSIAAATAATAILILNGRRIAGAGLAALASSALAWTLLGGILPHLDRLNLSTRIANAIDNAGLHPLRDAAPPVILSGYYEPSAIFLLGTQTILTNGAVSAERFSEGFGAAVVESREEAAFLMNLATFNVKPLKFAEIEGVNYSNGRGIKISIYRRAADETDSQD